MLQSFFPLVVLVIVNLKISLGAFNFLSLGDWGGANINAQDKANVYAVAQAMDTTAGTTNPEFLINTGDNFYWCGIMNATDPQIKVDFEEPYSSPNLAQVPWFSVLGNHEYGYSVQAQLDYAMANPKWIMPDRYYGKRVQIDKTTNTWMTMLFLDTSPCVAEYRETDPSKWDPCSTQYPTCSPSATDDDFEGPCNFHQNIMTQNCDEQYQWFQDQLSQVPDDDWLVVVGHHPLDEVNVFDFATTLQNRGFSIYLNGHVHTMSQYTLDGWGAYVTTGAGSLVNTPDQSMAVTDKKANAHKGDVVVAAELDGTTTSYRKVDKKSRQLKGNHAYATVFNQKIAGFTAHYFSDDYTQLTTKYYGYDGSVVHQFTSDRKGGLST
jgi:tartrate-resistant acid phosphatase type 5